MLDFSRNYFELFGLPVAFAVDIELLSDRYRGLLASLHPDRFVSASDQEKRLSMQASTLVNEAFQTLKAPLARARYLLLLHSGDQDSDIGTTHDGAFLMEQMELRETLAGAKGQNDPYAAVNGVMDHVGEHSGALCQRLESIFQAPSAEGMVEAREIVRKLQFLDKCRRDAENLEAELDDLL